MPSLDRIFRSLCASVMIAAWTSMPASAGFVVDKTTTLLGDDNVIQLTVYSLVTSHIANGSTVFNYTYTVTYNAGSADIHFFGVENPYDRPYFGTNNSPIDANAFTDPVYESSSGVPFFIEWTGDYGRVLTTGQTRTFSYQSFYAPLATDVYCYAIDGGSAAEGGVIGMGPVVPEPASLLALACGVAGMAPGIIRHRRHSAEGGNRS